VECSLKLVTTNLRKTDRSKFIQVISCLFFYVNFCFRFSAEAALERSKRNEAWDKKELASLRSKMCKHEAEAQRMFGNVI
jgi:hypothetical protein